MDARRQQRLMAMSEDALKDYIVRLEATLKRGDVLDDRETFDAVTMELASSLAVAAMRGTQLHLPF